MKALLFPGQGAQFEGMGKDLYEHHDLARHYFDRADKLLGFNLSDVMFNGSAEDLKQTKVTQPAVFLNALVRYFIHRDQYEADAVAGHSLGELTALVANGTLDFEDGLLLVYKRALAMQEACQMSDGTMAAVLGLADEVVEDVCRNSEGIVVPANYNCPGQIVISGERQAVENACRTLSDIGARRAIILPVGGAFHSPLMDPAKLELENAINDTHFKPPKIPVYQNVDARASTDPGQIKINLINQLTSSVKWTQTMANMKDAGIVTFTEFGAKVLSGFIKRYDRSLTTENV